MEFSFIHHIVSAVERGRKDAVPRPLQVIRFRRIVLKGVNMVTLDPCKRLIAIYRQLVPSILVNAKSGGFISRSALERNLAKLEERSYELSERCSRCNDCKLWQKENITDFFQDTREKIEVITKAFEEISGQMETPCLQV